MLCCRTRTFYASSLSVLLSSTVPDTLLKSFGHLKPENAILSK